MSQDAFLDWFLAAPDFRPDAEIVQIVLVSPFAYGVLDVIYQFLRTRPPRLTIQSTWTSMTQLPASSFVHYWVIPHKDWGGIPRTVNTWSNTSIPPHLDPMRSF